jgi:hypothetical protein
VLLEVEVQRLRARGVPVGEDDLRGLYVPDQEADRILATAGVARDGETAEAGDLLAACGERLARAQRLLCLPPAEAAAVAFCLVVETNPDLERLVSYVQDDVSRKRPRVELLLRLFWADSVHGQSAFDLESPLRRLHLVQLRDEPGQVATPLLARSVALDARFARHLLGGQGIDENLAERATLRAAPPGEPPAVPIDPHHLQPAVLALRGKDNERLGRTATALALHAGLSGVLELQFGGLAEITQREIFERAAREAALTDAALLIRGLEALDEPVRTPIAAALAETCAPLVLVASEAENPWHGASVEIPSLTVEERLDEWHTVLSPMTLAEDANSALSALAAKFELDTGAIEDAAKTALGFATARDPASPTLVAADLYAAARARSAPILSSLASKVTQHKAWADLILEPDPLAQLQEVCAMVEHRHQVYDEWGFGRKLSSGKGVVSLFAGQSGTGKTMGAGVIAGELGLDLYRIDLSGVVSKYIGETEKNLGAIFRDASLSNAILFFDEADALFGKRSEVRDAHDRYANIETAYLLQQIEDYSGLVILSTNLKMNLDEAFLRRMHFVVDFPMPEEQYRLRIWETTTPAEVPLDPSADFAFLAKQFRISGGNIRNIVLAAAFLAAHDGTAMGMRHLIRATRREFQKLGRMVTEADFGEHIVHLE